MHTYRIGEAADMLGVSSDTLRRWIDSGRLPAERDEQGRRVVPGRDLAVFAREMHGSREGSSRSSARNRFAGIVTEVILGDVSAQVEIQAGPFRVVSMISRESAEELKLEPGVPAVAVIKSTNVVVEKA
jgi:molybdopterin-binding protein